MSFSTAANEMKNLIAKEETIIKNASSIVAEAIIDRQKRQGLADNMTSTISDVEKLVSGFSPETREAILIRSLIMVASNGKFGASASTKKASDIDYSDMFKGRRMK